MFEREALRSGHGKQSLVDSAASTSAGHASSPPGKRTLVERQATPAQTEVEQHVHLATAARTDVTAIRDSALPAFLQAVQRTDLGGFAHQVAVMRAAHQVQHMVMVVEQRVQALCDAGLSGDLAVSLLRSELTTLRERAAQLGVYRGADELLPAKDARSKESSPGTAWVHSQSPPAAMAAVQRKSALDAHGLGALGQTRPAENDTRAIAAHGVATARSPIPHAATIQRAFGRHDVLSIRAQIGGPAAAAAAAIGAKAYATGSTIAFASEPDLHTAAHEAAHVVQQRAGLAPAGNLDRPGDELEQHADRVADAVVAGRSAEPLLDAVVGARSSTTTARSVQRKPDAGGGSWWSAVDERTRVVLYLAAHEARVWNEVTRYLYQVALPAPHPRVPWRDISRFVDATIHRTRSLARLSSGSNERIGELLAPSDHVAVLAPLVETLPQTMWSPAIGIALAQLLEGALVASLKRLGPRWAAAADTKPEAEGIADERKSLVAASSIVTSHPFDVAVRAGLTVGGVVDHQDLQGAARKTARPAQRLRAVKLQWQGWRDPALWNWVKVTEPADATAEDVAAELWPQSGKASGTLSPHAHRLTAAPPMFGVPPDLARMIPEARFFAPKQNDDGTHGARVTALAGSVAADELGLSQAKPPGAAKPAKKPKQASSDVASTLRLLDDCELQLSYIVAPLSRWGAHEPVTPALRWVMTKRVELAVASPQERAKWVPVIVQQRQLLARIAAGVRQLAKAASSDGTPALAGPMKRVVTTYARAAGASFLPKSCEALIAEASAQQSAMTLDTVRASTHDLLLAAGTGAGLDAAERKDVADTTATSRMLQSKLLAGAEVDGQEVEAALLAAQEIALKTRIQGIRSHLATLQAIARKLGSGWVSTFVAALHGSFRDIDAVASRFENHLVMVEAGWRGSTAQADAIRDQGEHATDKTQARRDGLERAQSSFARIQQDRELVHVLETGASTIDRQAEITGWVTICAQLAAMIGISMIAGAAGGAVGRWVAGGLMRANAIKNVPLLANAARLVGSGFGVAADAAINTAGSVGMKALERDDGSNTAAKKKKNPTTWQQFKENVLSTAGSTAVLRGIGADLELATAIQRRTESLWARSGSLAKITLAKTVTISSHVILSVAMTRVAHMMATGKRTATPMETREWFLQGASIAVGRYIHGQLAQREPLFAKLAVLRDCAAVQKLLADARALQRAAQVAEDHPESSDALELAGKHRKLIADEQAVLADVANDPAARNALGVEQAELRQASRAAGRQAAELAHARLGELALHESGLEEVVPGEAWTGSQDQLGRLRGAARKAQLSFESSFDPGSKTWRVTIDGQAIAVHVRGEGKAAAAESTVDGANSGRILSDAERTAIRSVTSKPTGHVDPARRIADAARPARTSYGDVWPGDVPAYVPDAQRVHFEAAKKIYDQLKKDGFQGASAARLHWTQYLVEHGIAVDGVVRHGGRHEVYEQSELPRRVPHSDVALPHEPAMGTRSPNTGRGDLQTSLAALDQIVAHGSTLKGARHEGGVVTVSLADGRTWRIEIDAPRPTAPGEMAALAHGPHGDTVWVSDTLPDAQVPRALGAILGEALARAGRAPAKAAANGARFGELDAMFAHREAVAKTVMPEAPRDAMPDAIKAHAIVASRAESTARINAEIDLALLRLDVLGPGPRRDQALAAMPPELAARVRAQLAHHGAIGFRPEAVVADTAITRPRAMPTTTLATSSVLPDAPAEVRAYGEADRVRVLELRVELAAIQELDARIALRDQPGTNGGRDIAKGESRSRAQHVARARGLMADLQLGGGDRVYIEGRLKELAAVFPGVERDLVPAVENRVARRASAEAVHQRAEAFRATRDAQQAALLRQVVSARPFTTNRLVVGDGSAALANIASLGIAKDGATIDPASLLVLGNPDLLARLDPSLLWGQRAAVYDRADQAHPAFSDANGHGDGSLRKAVEDPGEFLHVGELRDAMDLARERLGIIAVPGEARRVETARAKDPSSPAWEVDAEKFPVRVRAVIGGAEHYLYAAYADLTSGPGKPRMPHEKILSPGERAPMLEKGVLFSGEQLLQGKDVRGKRVLVMAFGPTGAWAAVAASKGGASRVDFPGAAGGELGTGALKAGSREGEPRPGNRTDDIPSNDSSMKGLSELDRVQAALDGSANLHVTYDRIVHIERQGEGAVVTYAHGPGENAELYQVAYDVIAMTMGFTTADNTTRVPGAAPTVKEMMGEMKMTPQRNTDAPVLEDAETGRVRVMGSAAGDAVNLVTDPVDWKQRNEGLEFRRRREEEAKKASADSPDERVVEGVGRSSRTANQPKKGPR